MLDSREYSAMSVDERKRAEEENARRMARQQGLEDLLDEDGGEDDERRGERRGRFDRGRGTREDVGEEEAESESDIEQDDELDLKALDQVQLREFLAQEKVRSDEDRRNSRKRLGYSHISSTAITNNPLHARFCLQTRRIINKKFWKFLSTYIGNVSGGDGSGGDGSGPPNEDDETARKRKKKWLKKQTPVYSQRISQMCSMNLSSLEVSFIHLSEDEPQLAIFLADAPADMLEILSSVATR